MKERDPAERVVITGMGIAAPTPRGFEVEGFWRDLQQNRHAIKRIDHIIRGYEDEIDTRLGAPLPDFNLGYLLESEGFGVRQAKIDREAKRWHKSSQAIVYTGAMALRQAGLMTNEGLEIDKNQVHSRRFGVYEGTGVGGALALVETQQALDSQKTDSPRKLAELAYVMLHLLPGRVDEVPAKVFGAQAFNETFATECAASLSSVAAGVDDLRQSRADVVLAGGVEMAAHPVTIWAFETLKALNKSSNPSVVPRPFSRNPGGLVLGEGAGNVVLETLEHVLWRQKKFGAKVVIQAEILGWGKSSDAYHDTAPSEQGSGWAIDAALEDAGIEAEELQDTQILAHATATDGDLNEFITIQRRFKPRQIVGVSSIKGHTGHTFGGAGVINLITGTLSMRDKIVPSNRNLRHPLPQTEGWPMIPHRAVRVRNVANVLVNAFGFGGKNRVILLGKPPELTI